MSSPVRLFNQKLFLALDKAFKKLCAWLPIHDICRGFKFGKLDDHCFFWIICRQFACRHQLLSDVLLCRAPCISLKLLLCLAAVSFNLQCILAADTNKQLYLLYAKTLPLKYITMTSLSCPGGITFSLNEW